MPQDAIQGGHEIDGSPIYIGKTTYKFEEMPIKVVPMKREAFVGHYGREYVVHSYQLLCGSNVEWGKIPSTLKIPPNAIPGGKTYHGETLYIGRAKCGNGRSLAVGKVSLYLVHTHRVVSMYGLYCTYYSLFTSVQ